MCPAASDVVFDLPITEGADEMLLPSTHEAVRHLPGVAGLRAASHHDPDARAGGRIR
jgi:hypothetical protein